MKILFVPVLLLTVWLFGCGKAAQEVSANTVPPPAEVEPDMNAGNLQVDHPEQFPVVEAHAFMATPDQAVTGVVAPDVSRQVPVPSLASGRVIEISARLGEEVKKGQVLFKVRSSDIAGAYSDYQKALKNEKLALENERLAKIQQDRAHTLFEHGAVPKSTLEIADNGEVAAATAVENAKVDSATTAERLKLLGSDLEHPSGIVDVTAPSSGVITDQQVTEGAGVQALTAPNPFTISDLSQVWIVCDVYENNLAKVHVGDYADIRLNAYPGRVLKGKVQNISPILDANLHTAKVRLELENPGLMRFGMFVTATFHGDEAQMRATIPATAILHLHDREWVYMPTEANHFKRIEVVAGEMLKDGLQEVKSGLKPGEKVVSNALVLQSTVEQ
ncbi:MAG: efflux RND transporter periplasmic adaptor subunit [Bryobacterales bacterium]|nr:efflux RND transporter periplasmic adaptor subunit [Bryobacterales bacterium]MBV9400009.1 efflux RND transporter periplasmic adaptor subunit [Bryobacterales bacterium]